MEHKLMTTAKEEIAFVERAAAKFSEKPEMATYTDQPVSAGCLFAVRWGSADDCVLLLRLEAEYPPTVYGEAISPKQIS